MYHVKPCWIILFPFQFNNHSLQLYTVEKCIISNLVGLFYSEVSLIIMVSNYIQEKIFSIILN